MKRLKKTLACLLASLFILTALPMNSVIADEMNSVITEHNLSSSLKKAVTSFSAFVSSAAIKAAAEYAGTVNCSYKGTTLTITGTSDMTYSDTYNLEKYAATCTKVIVKDGITGISVQAFKNYKKLKSVSLPSSLSLIDAEAFWNCSSLTEITIPATVTSLGKALFRGCTSLSKLTTPFTGYRINSYKSGYLGIMFGKNAAEGFTEVNQGIYKNSRNEDELFYIPDSLEQVTVTGDALFSNAFTGCSMIKKISVNVESIPSYFANRCASLTTVDLGTKLKKIEGQAFTDCPHLEGINLPDTVEEIGAAFGNDTDFSYINIPNSVKCIWGDAFKNTKYYNSLSEEFCVVGDGLLIKYTGTSADVTVPNNVKKICGGFYNSKYARNITLGDNTVYIGPYSFNSITESVNLNEGLEEISQFAFFRTTNIKKIVIPSTLKVISTNAFYELQLKEIKINDGVEIIEANAFRNSLTGVTNLYVPDSVKKIGSGGLGKAVNAYTISLPFCGESLNVADSQKSKLLYVFGATSASFDSVTIRNGKFNANSVNGVVLFNTLSLPDTVTCIEKNMFATCKVRNLVAKSLNTIESGAFKKCYIKNLPWDNVESIGDGAFENCTVLENIQLPKIKSMGTGAFKDCINLKSISLSEYIQEIPDKAFSGCKSLSSIVLPESCITVGDSAFFETAIEKLDFPEGLKTIKENAFSSMPDLRSVYFSSTVSDIALNSFDNCPQLSSINLNENNPYFKCENGWLYKKEGSFILSVTIIDGTLTIPAGIKDITYDAFDKMVGITTFDVNENNSQFTVSDGILYTKDMTDIVKCEITKSGALIIPESVKNVRDNAFIGCYGITSIDIMSNETVIGVAAFKGMNALSVLSVPSITSENQIAYYFTNNPNISFSSYFNKLIIKNQTDSEGLKLNRFSAFTCLRNVIINGTITSVPSAAFSNCMYLENITLPDSVTTIGSRAFYKTAIKSISLSANITNIGAEAFRSCNYLLSITIPANVVKIGDLAFADCTSLSEIIYKSSDKTLSYMGDGVFASCDSLTSLQLPKGCTEIPQLFSSCHGIREVNIPDSVKIIHDNAFSGSALTSLSLPSGIKEIGAYAFAYCDNLNSITYDSPLIAHEIKVGEGAFSGCSSLTDAFFPKGVKSIPDYCYAVTKIKTLDIPNSVETIGASSFESCEYLTEVNISKKVNSIGNNAFNSCSNLSSVKFNNSAYTKVELGTYVFANCAFDNICVPNGCSEISSGMFARNPLKNLSFDDNIEVVGEYAFASSGIESLTITKNIEQIGDDAFFGCKELTEIKYENTDKSLSYFGDGVFRNCEKLSKPYLPEGCTRIPAEMFGSCRGFTEIVIPSTVKEICERAFMLCFMAKSVYIPKSVEVLEWGAFSGCSNLEKVIIEEGAAIIDSESFSECLKLEVIVIPDSVTSVGKDILKSSDNATIYCNENSYVSKYAAENNIKYTTFVVAPIENEVYSGEEICPEPDVSINGDLLTNVTDYTMSYKNNLNAGTANVFVRGVGDFKSLTAKCSFEILRKNVETVTVDAKESGVYNPIGNELPSVSVSDGERILIENSDFEVDYSENSAINLFGAGKYNYTVSGIGNYCGVKNMTYEIIPKDISETVIIYDDSVGVYDNNEELENGKDYSYSVEKESNEITVTGKGNYGGTTVVLQNKTVTSMWYISYITNIINQLLAVLSSIWNAK